MAGTYPVDLRADDPQPQSRLTVFFRIFMVIPHIIVLYFLGIALQAVALISWFAILFTGKLPEGMAGFMANVLHWQTRVSGYMYFLTGVYPPFAMGPQPYPVEMLVTPQLDNRNRVTVFFRIFMIIPHIIVLYFVGLVAGVLFFVAWIVGTITGKVPAGIHNFLAGTLRWGTRVGAYTILLTDEYPPFAMN